jgi:GTP-binding protein HflX
MTRGRRRRTDGTSGPTEASPDAIVRALDARAADARAAEGRTSDGVLGTDPGTDGAVGAPGTDGPLEGETARPMGRAERRRAEREVIGDEAPREGVDIIRPVERAIIVGVGLPERTDAEVAASLDELERLLDTAGGEVVHRVTQRRQHPEPATYVGDGKVTELRELARQHDADSVVFDDDLSPAQQRTLEERIGRKVLDRTIVILDIFAQHAASREGKLQVELAQLTYLLPRLRGWGQALSRQAGGRAAGGVGIGGRGPGETQLEVDRRRLMRRITAIRRELAAAGRVRAVKAARRNRHDLPVVALVGYTNAGKSSLLNRLTGADVLVEDRLFATLDATLRRLPLADGRTVALSDTVGFVRKLPHGLVEAFRSTLEETADADLLLHVVDAGHPEALAHVDAVREVLAEIGADRVREVVVLNQVDRADPDALEDLERVLVELRHATPVRVSAVTGEGSAALLARIAADLPDPREHLRVHLPYAREDLVARVHREGRIVAISHDDHGTELEAEVDAALAAELRAADDRGALSGPSAGP